MGGGLATTQAGCFQCGWGEVCKIEHVYCVSCEGHFCSVVPTCLLVCMEPAVTAAAAGYRLQSCTLVCFFLQA